MAYKNRDTLRLNSIRVAALSIYGLLLSIFPLTLHSEEPDELLKSAITVSDLEIVFFTTEKSAAVSFGSVAKLLETMSAADEISRAADHYFVIFFAGKNIFIDGSIDRRFTELTGGTVLENIRKIEAPTVPCASFSMRFEGDEQGLLVFLDTTEATLQANYACIVAGLSEAWDRTQKRPESDSIGGSIVNLVEILTQR